RRRHTRLVSDWSSDVLLFRSWVPRTSSTSRDQAVFADQATNVRLPSGRGTAQDRQVRAAVSAAPRRPAPGEAGADSGGFREGARSAADGSGSRRGYGPG